MFFDKTCEKQATVATTKRGVDRGSLLGALAAIAFLFSLPVVQWMQFGRSAGERLATDLVLPMGLLWSCLTLIVGVGLGRRIWSPGSSGDHSPQRTSRLPVGLIVCLWLMMTVLGNKHLSRYAFSITESQFTELDPEIKFDSVVVLGGGVGSGPDRTAQLTGDGDRIRPALQLWNQGRVDKIIVTGSAAIPGKPGPAELTYELFRSFGVPREALITIEGVNTSAEMENLKALYEREFPSSSLLNAEFKHAIVTSAFHMPRALRLAKSRGLNMLPITTIHRNNDDPIGIAASVVPSAEAMGDLGRCQKEWLAKLLKR